jgi:hypothetical protein
MKSALFVDFDNVYTQLRALQPAAAERFARQPTEWIRWLVESLGWFNFFWLCAALAVPGMLLLVKVAPWHRPAEAVSHLG